MLDRKDLPQNTESAPSPSFLSWIPGILKPRVDTDIRSTLEEIIEEPVEAESEDAISAHERLLLSNILKLRDVDVANVMVPRADIVAVDVNTDREGLFKLLGEQQFTRLPVYQDTLDNVIGTLHLKDIMEALAKGDNLDSVRSLIREPLIVSPAMPILELLLQMKESRRHMALVVDEYGGIDGLITIGEALEAIVGEIEDEHDQHEHPTLDVQTDGSILADARVEIGEFEERFGALLNEEERSESDTLGGLVFALAGRVPARGEIMTHSSGMMFEVIEADQRRISRLRIRHIPKKNA